MTGQYVIKDGVRTIYDGDDLHDALALMRRASARAKLFRLDKGEKGIIETLLAFRRSTPPEAKPPSKEAVAAAALAAEKRALFSS